jgi:hypothetical protein
MFLRNLLVTIIITISFAQNGFAQKKDDDDELIALRAQIDSIITELSRSTNPEIQRGLAEARAKLRASDGIGQCVTNRAGKVMCSSKAGGWAAIDANGQAVCETSCVAEK